MSFMYICKDYLIFNEFYKIFPTNFLLFLSHHAISCYNCKLSFKKKIIYSNKHIKQHSSLILIILSKKNHFLNPGFIESYSKNFIFQSLNFIQ